MPNKHNDPEYWIAIQNDDIDTLEVLHVTNPNLNATLPTTHQYTGLYHAIHHRSTRAFKWLLQRGATTRVDKFTESNKRMSGTLREATRTHDYATEFINALIAAGEDITLPDESGLTALHHVTHHGNASAVKTLINAGADINAACQFGFTPLMIAAKRGHQTITETLMNAQANVNAVNAYGRSILDEAHDDTKETLRAAGARTATELNHPPDPFYTVNPLNKAIQMHAPTYGEGNQHA